MAEAAEHLGELGKKRETDEELMAKAVAGDRDAYAQIFKRQEDKIRRSAYFMLHDANAADDVTQETFAKGLAHIATYRGESNPQAWFYSIALNVCRHMLRSARNGAEVTGSQKLERGQRPRRARTRGAFTMASGKETGRLLSVALGFLTEAQREVFILHYQDELPYDQIGQVLGIKPGAARALAHRAKAVLRSRLGPYVEFPQALFGKPTKSSESDDLESQDGTHG